MPIAERLRGVLAPVVTPFDRDLHPDPDKLVRHCRWLLENDVGLAVFGTNSEANSLSVAEKLELLERLVENGIPAHRMMPGTGCCALTDSVELTRKAVALGCGGVLMLPPFYYKNVSDEGLYRSFATVIDRVADDSLRIYLYHIPPVAQVPIRFELIERLLRDFPGIIAGIKDSAGDFDHTRVLLERFQPSGFDVFCGSETFLLATLRGGGAGCISATANVNPSAIAALAAGWRDDDAQDRQGALDDVRRVFQAYDMIPALKAAVGRYSGDREWSRVRPPLVELDENARDRLHHALDRVGFSMPGLVS